MRYHDSSPLTQSIDLLKEVVLGNGTRSSVTNREYTTRPKLSLEDINTLHMLDPVSFKTRKSFVKFKNEVQVNDAACERNTNETHLRGPMPIPQGADISTYNRMPTYIFHNNGNNEDVNTTNTYKHTGVNAMDDDDTAWSPRCQFVSDAMPSRPDQLYEHRNMIRRGRPLRDVPKRGVVRRVGEYTKPPPSSRSKTLTLRSIMRRITEYPEPRKLASTRTSWPPKMWPLRANIRAKRDPQSTNYKRCMSRYMENAVNDRGRDRTATEDRAIRLSDCISEEDGDDDKCETWEESDAMFRETTYESGDDASQNTSNSNQSMSSFENVRGSTGRPLHADVADRRSSHKATAHHSSGSRMYTQNEGIYRDAQHQPKSNLSERLHRSERRESSLQRSRYANHHSNDRDDSHGNTNCVVSSDIRHRETQRNTNGPRSRSTPEDMLTLQRAKGKFLRYQQHKSRHQSPDKVSSLDRVYGRHQQLSTYFETINDQSIVDTDASEAESDAATVLENVYYRNSTGVHSRAPATTPDHGHVVAVKARAPGHNQIEHRRARSTSSNSKQPRRHTTHVPAVISPRPICPPCEMSSESDPLLDGGCAEYVDGIPLVCESDIIFVEETPNNPILDNIEKHDTMYKEAVPMTRICIKQNSDVKGYAALSKDNLARMNKETAASNSTEIDDALRPRNTSSRRRTGRESSATRHQAKSTTRKPTAPEQKSTSAVNVPQRRDASAKGNDRVSSVRPNRHSPERQTNQARPVYGKYSFSHVLCEKPPPANSDSTRRLSGDQLGTCRVVHSRRPMPPNAPATDSKGTNPTVTRNASDSRQVPWQKNHRTTCNSASEDIQTSSSKHKHDDCGEPIQMGSDISNGQWPTPHMAPNAISATGNDMDAATTVTEAPIFSSMESEAPASSSEGNSDTAGSINDGSSGNAISKSSAVVDNACQTAAGDQDTLDAMNKKIPGGRLYYTISIPFLFHAGVVQLCLNKH